MRDSLHSHGPFRALSIMVQAVHNGNWFTIARCDSRGKLLDGTDYENAVFIAKACNTYEAHQELLLVTEKMLVHFDHHSGWGRETAALYEKLRDAVIKAKEEHRA